MACMIFTFGNLLRFSLWLYNGQFFKFVSLFFENNLDVLFVGNKKRIYYQRDSYHPPKSSPNVAPSQNLPWGRRGWANIWSF